MDILGNKLVSAISVTFTGLDKDSSLLYNLFRYESVIFSNPKS